MNQDISLGERLRALRNERDLSQRDLAKQAGVSTNAISLIERDETSPSVATLQALATALNVKMGYFFESDGQNSVLHVKASQQPGMSTKGVRISGIGERLRGQEMEPFFVFLEPNSGSGDRQVVHTGHELVYCLSGVVEYIVDGNVYTLEKGDFLIFEAHLPHIWRNTSAKNAEFLLVLQTPNQSSEPVERHFKRYPSIGHIG